MTSALRGREGCWPKHDDSTDRLREWDSDKEGRGSKSVKNLHDFLYGWFRIGTSDEEERSGAMMIASFAIAFVVNWR